MSTFIPFRDYKLEDENLFLTHRNKDHDDFNLDIDQEELYFNQPILRKRGCSEKIVSLSNSKLLSLELERKSKSKLTKIDTFTKQPSTILESMSEHSKSSEENNQPVITVQPPHDPYIDSSYFSLNDNQKVEENEEEKEERDLMQAYHPRFKSNNK